MFRVMTHEENFQIEVYPKDILRFLCLNQKRRSRPVIVENHLGELEALRKIGFYNQGKAYRKIEFMPGEADKIESDNALKIRQAAVEILKITDLCNKYKNRLRLLALLPILAALLLYLFTKSPLALIALALYLPVFMFYGSFYTIMLENIASHYYNDGCCRQIAKQLDKKGEYPHRYDLSLPLM